MDRCERNTSPCSTKGIESAPSVAGLPFIGTSRNIPGIYFTVSFYRNAPSLVN